MLMDVTSRPSSRNQPLIQLLPKVSSFVTLVLCKVGKIVQDAV